MLQPGFITDTPVQRVGILPPAQEHLLKRDEATQTVLQQAEVLSGLLKYLSNITLSLNDYLSAQTANASKTSCRKALHGLAWGR